MESKHFSTETETGAAEELAGEEQKGEHNGKTNGFWKTIFMNDKQEMSQVLNKKKSMNIFGAETINLLFCSQYTVSSYSQFPKNEEINPCYFICSCLKHKSIHLTPVLYASTSTSLQINHR